MCAVAGSRRERTNSLRDQLFEEVYTFDFHQVVRLIESFTPGCVSLGEGSDPSKEALRICSRISFSFATADLHSFLPANRTVPMEGKPQLSINFLGLAGISKPLPTPYAYRFYQQNRWEDTATKDFLDIFNHRFSSLLYRIHKKFRVELASTNLENTMFGKVLSSISGIYQDISSFKNRLDVSDRALLGYSSYFWTSAHSAYGLKKILSMYFKIPIVVEQFCGEWVQAQDSEWSRLSSTKNIFNTLGKTVVLGTKVWDQNAGMNIHLGAVDYKTFLTFLPSGGRYNSFCDLIYMYIGDLCNIRVKFIINKKTVPKVKLGSKFCLGYTTWMHAKPFKEDDKQVQVNCKKLAY